MINKYFICSCFISFICGCLILKVPYAMALFLMSLFCALFLYKHVMVVLILSIIYLFIYSFATALQNYSESSFEFIAYNPLVTTIFISTLIYIIMHIKTVFDKEDENSGWLRKIIIIQLLLLFYILLRSFYMRFTTGYFEYANFYYIFISPFLLFIYITLASYKGELSGGNIKTVLKVFVFFSLINVFSGGVEYLLKKNIILEYFQNKDSYAAYLEFSRSGYRIFGLTGHPIRNSLLFLMGMIYSLSFKKFRNIAVLLMSVGIILTVTRTAFVLAIFALFIYLYFITINESGHNYLNKIAQILIVFMFLLILTSNILPFGSSLFERFMNDKGSSAVRLAGIKYLFNTILINPGSFILGSGTISSRIISGSILKREGGSFEIGWITMIMDYGLLVAIPYLLICFSIFSRISKKASTDNMNYILLISFIIILIQTNSYNGLMTIGSTSLCLWFVLGLCVANYINMNAKKTKEII